MERSCTCGEYDPCDVHKPPVYASPWKPVIPGSEEKYMERTDQLGRQVAYATRAGTWTTWFDAGFVGRPDIVMSMNAADANLIANGVTLLGGGTDP